MFVQLLRQLPPTSGFSAANPGHFPDNGTLVQSIENEGWAPKGALPSPTINWQAPCTTCRPRSPDPHFAALMTFAVAKAITSVRATRSDAMQQNVSQATEPPEVAHHCQDMLLGLSRALSHCANPNNKSRQAAAQQRNPSTCIQ